MSQQNYIFGPFIPNYMSGSPTNLPQHPYFNAASPTGSETTATYPNQFSKNVNFLNLSRGSITPRDVFQISHTNQTVTTLNPQNILAQNNQQFVGGVALYSPFNYNPQATYSDTYSTNSALKQNSLLKDDERKRSHTQPPLSNTNVQKQKDVPPVIQHINQINSFQPSLHSRSEALNTFSKTSNANSFQNDKIPVPTSNVQPSSTQSPNASTFQKVFKNLNIRPEKDEPFVSNSLLFEEKKVIDYAPEKTISIENASQKGKISILGKTNGAHNFDENTQKFKKEHINLQKQQDISVPAQEINLNPFLESNREVDLSTTASFQKINLPDTSRGYEDPDMLSFANKDARFLLESVTVQENEVQNPNIFKKELEFNQDYFGEVKVPKIDKLNTENSKTSKNVEILKEKRNLSKPLTPDQESDVYGKRIDGLISSVHTPAYNHSPAPNDKTNAHFLQYRSQSLVPGMMVGNFSQRTSQANIMNNMPVVNYPPSIASSWTQGHLKNSNPMHTQSNFNPVSHISAQNFYPINIQTSSKSPAPQIITQNFSPMNIQTRSKSSFSSSHSFTHSVSKAVSAHKPLFF